MESSYRRKFNIKTNVVLTRPIYQRNIGAASRAMANMGADRLILIQPQTEIGYEAQEAAASGQGPLQGHTKYSAWSDFFSNEPDGIRLCFTARDGRGRQTKNFAQALSQLESDSPRLLEDPVCFVYLIFGPEDWGLANEDLSFATHCCRLPTYGENTSLNLAQAVLLALSILREKWGPDVGKEGMVTLDPLVKSGLPFPDESLRRWLEEMGFNLNDRRVNAYTVLKRLLLQSTPTEKEYQMLELVLQQGIRKLEEYNQMRKNLGLPVIDKYG